MTKTKSQRRQRTNTRSVLADLNETRSPLFQVGSRRIFSSPLTFFHSANRPEGVLVKPARAQSARGQLLSRVTRDVLEDWRG